MDEETQDESGRYLKKNASDGLPGRSVGRWAKDKLDVLNTYMSVFTTGMKKSANKKFNWDGLAYIDLFAGPGRCFIRETGEEILGSPLLATGHSFDRLYFVEQEQWAFDALSERTSKDGRCKIYKGNCNEAVRRIIRDRRPDTLYFAFIDPTGLDVHFETIQALSQSLRCDLLINWYMSAITRNMKYWKAAGKSDRLDAFFGTDRWLQAFDQPTEKATFRRMVNLYSEQLENVGYKLAEPLSIKNSKQAEMYWLRFASKANLGLKYWKISRKASSSQGEFDFDSQ